MRSWKSESARVIQHIRPEIIGFVLGALVAALAFREFRACAGSAPIVRFVLEAFNTLEEVEATVVAVG